MSPDPELFGVKREQALLKARTLIDGFNLIGCDALNVGARDFAAGVDFLMSLKETAEFPFISGNIVRENSRDLVFDPYTIVERDGLRFGIIGLTTSLPAHLQGLNALDYVEEGKRLLAELESKTDYQVVLLNGSQEQAKSAQSSLVSADFIFLSGSTQRPRHTTKGQKAGSRVFNLGKQGKSLAVVEIAVADADSSLTDITHLKDREKFITRQLRRLGKKDPSKSLDELYADKPRFLERIHKLQSELTSIQTDLKKASNTLRFKFVPMDKKVGDDPTLLAMVNKTLSECSRLAARGGEKTSLSNPGSAPLSKPKSQSAVNREKPGQ